MNMREKSLSRLRDDPRSAPVVLVLTRGTHLPFTRSLSLTDLTYFANRPVYPASVFVMKSESDAGTDAPERRSANSTSTIC